jgi:hypothetical protein
MAGMKHILLKVKAVGVAGLLAVGLIGIGLASAVPAQASARSPVAIGGAPANLENAGNWATCIDANSNDYAKNGDGIQLWGCNAHAEQEWTLTSAGQLQSAGTNMCIDANSNDYPKNGDGIQLWGCNTHPEQAWTLTSAGQLQSAGTNMCIDANSNDYAKNGDRIQLWACNTRPEQEWRLDWAAASFCAANGTAAVPYMGTTFDGVAACGVKYDGTSSNLQGRITYNGVTLDSDGFQCVELAARYFYYVTGQTPASANGGGYAWALYQAHPQYGISPGGANGGVSTYESTLVAGDIISMWSSSDLTGHVAIVTGVFLDGGTGTIRVVDENASASGSDAITVTNGKMSFNGLNDFQWVYNLP